MNTVLIAIFLLTSIAVTGLFIYYFKKRDTFTNCSNGIFLSDEEVRAFLRNDKDGYVQNMSAADLHARKVKTSLQYINKISQCHKNDLLLDPSDLQLLSKCTINADKFLEKYVYKNVIKGSDIAKFPWKLAIVCDDYEEGFPHTREDVIFLTRKRIKVNEEALTSLLIHEKVHIFQRYNVQLMDWFLVSLGYTAVAYANDPKYKGLIRSNPDINNKVYAINGKELVFQYKSDKPSGINDVNNVNGIEHPYEQMAYDIGNEYLRQGIKKMVNMVK